LADPPGPRTLRRGCRRGAPGQDVTGATEHTAAKSAILAGARAGAGMVKEGRMSLVVGVPTESKIDEFRVAVTPEGVRELEMHGIEVLVQAGAGAGSGLADAAYRAAGAEIVASPAEVWERAQLVCKVKEPHEDEFAWFRDDLTVFTFLHLAAYPKVADALLDHGATGIAYETVQLADGSLPLLAPMSEVAGRMSVQIGAHFLERPHGGRGVLLGGPPGVNPGRVVVLGAGNVGWNAAWMAAGLQAEVNLLDKNIDRLRHVDQIQMGRITTLASHRGNVERVVPEADLVIGAVLVPGGRAPVVVTDAMVRSMKPGAVVIDIAVDQGGCVETTHETTHEDPVYETHGVIHYGVGNVPGAVPNTSTYALTNVTLPYLAELARLGVPGAVRADPGLARGVNTWGGHVVNEAVAEALGRPAADLDTLLGPP
jgi:alanine dehydrogenase